MSLFYSHISVSYSVIIIEASSWSRWELLQSHTNEQCAENKRPWKTKSERDNIIKSLPSGEDESGKFWEPKEVVISEQDSLHRSLTVYKNHTLSLDQNLSSQLRFLHYTTLTTVKILSVIKY